jgi:RNA recognition motif-containing protein
MTKKSLSTSIFGESKDNEGGLSSLFGASASALPAMPNNVDFPETTTERAKREKKEEKRKKRKTREEKEAEKELIKLPPSQKVKSEKKKKERKPKTEAKEEEKDDEIEEKGEPSDEDRTIFVGNLPLDINRKRLESLFRECGKIKSSRLRSFGTTGVKVAPEHAGNQVRIRHNFFSSTMTFLKWNNIKNLIYCAPLLFCQT